MIRAIKFCARLDFRMAVDTWQGIVDNCATIANASTARVQEEIRRLLESRCALRSFGLLDTSGLLAKMIPEVNSYLNRAYGGQVAEDPRGELLWNLLEALDRCLDNIEDKEERRDLGIETLTLPLVLEAGLRRAGVQSDNVREVLVAMGNRLGFSRGLRASIRQTYSVLGSMLAGSGGRNETQLVTKNGFPHAFMLYSVLADAGLVSAEELAVWQKRLDVFRAKQRVSAAKSKNDAAPSVSHRSKNRRKRMRRRSSGASADREA